MKQIQNILMYTENHKKNVWKMMDCRDDRIQVLTLSFFAIRFEVFLTSLIRKSSLSTGLPVPGAFVLPLESWKALRILARLTFDFLAPEVTR